MKPCDGILQAVATNEAHGVIRSAVGVGAKAVYRHDARMLEAPRNFGLQHEASSAVWFVGVFVLNFLEGDFAIQFRIEGDVDFTQAPFGVRPYDLKTRAGGYRRAAGARR